MRLAKLSSSTTQTLGANIATFRAECGASSPLVQNRKLAWTSISDGFCIDKSEFLELIDY